MSDALWAARLGDALNHTSMMADILGGVLEVAANIAITALATAAVVAATGITVVTGGLRCARLGGGHDRRPRHEQDRSRQGPEQFMREFQ